MNVLKIPNANNLKHNVLYTFICMYIHSYIPQQYKKVFQCTDDLNGLIYFLYIQLIFIYNN